MARFSPTESFDALKEGVQKAVSGLFPIVGKTNTLELHDISVKDTLSTNDFRSQKEAKLSKKTWSVPVEASVVLRNNSSGAVVDKQKMNLLHLPKITSRHSHIVDGQEYQIENQWRLKPGVYSLVKADGALEAHFNSARTFHLNFDPATREFKMNYGNSNIPLRPLMEALGVSESAIEAKWGKEIASSNAGNARSNPAAILRFNKVASGEDAANLEAAKEYLWKSMQETKLSPDVTRITLGKEYSNVTGDALLDASTKLLHISQGKTSPDPRDSLKFKELHSVEDFAAERIKKGTRDILRRVQNTLDRKTSVRDILGPDIFNRPIKQMFLKNSLSVVPDQTNPLEMLSTLMKTTITGDGGIKSEHAITPEAKLIDTSHFGFLDPLHTPEGATTGVTLHLSLGAVKDGHNLVLKMRNLKTGKQEKLTPEQVSNARVVLPDQVNWIGGKNGKPEPVSNKIKISMPDGSIQHGSIKDADYVMLEPMHMFSVATNLIPFLPSDHPNRTTMAGRHMEQAMSLKHREQALVQSFIQDSSMDRMIGKGASNISMVDGVVHQIKKDAIVVKDAHGKRHEVQLYDNFPLNEDKAFIHSTPIVKVGDSIKAKQVIADTNFTKDGVLALGTNLRVGFLPYKGYNFEDGIVISDTASKKLTSEHLYRHSFDRDLEHVFDKKKFQAYAPSVLTKEHAEKLDDDGVVKIGTRVLPGDTLIAALRKRNENERREDKELSRLHKSMVKPYSNVSIKWEGDFPGTVTESVKNGKQLAVHVKTEEPLEVGDKLAGRHGNKGIVVQILPDHEMPKTKDERPIHVLLNPLGVAGRTNLGQVLETAAAKIAEKTGETYHVKNFSPGSDLHQQVTDDLKKHGISDKEEVFDAATGKSMGEALVGPQYMIKLHHQVDKKLRSRALGYGYAYDKNMIPKGGGPHGAQSLGTLGLYAMLAHGAVHNLREMQTVKSDASQGDHFWSALQAGEMLPVPRTTFAYEKFMGYLNGLRINVKKDGHNLVLSPMTDKHVLEMSNGRVTDMGKWITAKNMRPEVGGLFDQKITGGTEGTKWSHYTLPEPFPNPVFAGMSHQQGAIQSLLGISDAEFEDLLAGNKGYDAKTNKISASDTHGALVGGKAIQAMLSKIDVKRDLTAAKQDISVSKLKGNRLDQLNKKIKFLQALDKSGLKPSEAYMVNHVPIMPPSMRPLAVLPNGTISEDDLNGLYKNLHLSASRYEKMSPLIPDDDESKREIRKEVYDGLRAVAGIGGYPRQVRRGILDVIAGKRVVDNISGEKAGSPKEGYFQDKLVERKQDLSMRSTIIPEPALSLDEVGIPKSAALEIYKPFVIRELRNLLGISPLSAQEYLKKGGELVDKALDRVVANRPVLLKRDPVLHKYGVQAFKTRIVSGKAVQIHPLVTSGYNADFDGDAMGAFVPVTAEAVAEAHKMFPSKNLFSTSTGKVMYAPTNESKLGLYGITREGNKTAHAFKAIPDMEASLRKGDVKLTDQVSIGGIKSTVGRFMVAGALPESMRKEMLQKQTPLDAKSQSDLLEQVAHEHSNDYGQVVNKLKDLGNLWSTSTAFSIGMHDIAPERAMRDAALAKADAKIAKMTGPHKDEQAIEAYVQATKEMDAHLRGVSEHGNNLMVLHNVGMKGGTDTVRQIRAAPMLMLNAKGETIPTPARHSYAEGLDVADYWTTMSGARKGIIQKVQAVAEPGYLSKQVMNSVMNSLILDHDCGTDKGIALPIDEKDVLDRYLAAAVKVGNKTFPIGTLVTPEVRSVLRNNKVGKVVVRSPLRCLHGPGICQKCYGLDSNGRVPEKGLNVGILAGQAIGERSVQMAMKSFHCSHADSLVFIRGADNRVSTNTLEDLYDLLPGDVTCDGIDEIKTVTDLDIWDGEWVRLTNVRRHRPTHPMTLVSDRHLVTICQDNHPIGVWENNVRCEKCDYHRLRGPHKNLRQYCAKCGHAQQAPVDKVGRAGFLSPIELSTGKHYLHHSFPADIFNGAVSDLPFDPYVIGMYLAEGCIAWKKSHKNQLEKRPYQIVISQNTGEIRDELERRIATLRPIVSHPKCVIVNNVELGQKFHDLFGRYSRHVALPADFMQYSESWLCDFLAGVIDGDGTVQACDDGPEAIAVDTTSFALAQQIVFICIRLGIVAGIVATTVRDLTRHQGFRICMRVTDTTASKLCNSIKVRSISDRSPAQEPSKEGYRLVSAVREVLYTHEYVYDATTSTGTLYVGGLKHHNSGGTASSRQGLVDDFEQVQNLLNFPLVLPGSATLSTSSGKVSRVEKDPAGGHNVYVGEDRHYVPQSRGIPTYRGEAIKKGQEVKKGEPLSHGPTNPHEMLELTGIEPVQNHLASELHTLYASEGIRRRNHEVVVKAMTNLTKIEDPGSSEFIRGDFAPTTYVTSFNKNIKKGEDPIKHKPILKGVKVLPLEMQEDWLAKLNHERLHQTVIDAAQRGWSSSIHGMHPIPAIVHGASIGRGKPGEY